MERLSVPQVLASSCALLSVAMLLLSRPEGVRPVAAAEGAQSTITVDYPHTGSMFPPEITPPTFLWHDAETTANHWRIDVRFSDGTQLIHFESTGATPPLGRIDERCISTTNELPKLTQELETSHSWVPDAASWEKIKKHSVTSAAIVTITGLSLNNPRQALSSGETSFTTSKDPVGAPIFYRDVPLMPSATEQGVIKPLDQNRIPLIQWRLRNINTLKSQVVLEGIHSCANCHSFSNNGKTFGMDMDGPRNDKGLYALVSVQKQMTIRNSDMVNWNPTGEHQFQSNRVAFMSQVSPDGKYVLTMLTAADQPAQNNYFVSNFTDYRFLQVFYPTRGILAWYDRASGHRYPLPGADDPDYVQTGGVWSPDGKYVVFARAKAQDPYPAGFKQAKFANDPNELQIKYDLYRVPFNNGRGGKAEPIEGAANNGMSNSFAKISPDGRWLVFVEAKNGLLMRPDSQLYIVPTQGGTARRLNANMSPMNSWHSWSPNGRWLVFSSKSRGPYTKMFLTHIDENGNDSPAILIDEATAANRAVNIPEFVNIVAGGIANIATPALDMYKEFDDATGLSTKGDHATALAAWTAMAAKYPDDSRIQGNLGAELEKAGRYEEAILCYQKALELNPLYSFVHPAMASVLVKVGRTDEALTQYELALKDYPTWPNLLNSYGNLLARTGRLDEAIAEFNKAIESMPDYAEAYNNLGIALTRNGRSEEAIAQLNKAIEIDANYAEPHNNLGVALMSNGEWHPEQAQKEFMAALAIDPHYADASCSLGILNHAGGRDAEAEKLFRDAIRNNPRYMLAYLRLADLLMHESRMSDAKEVVREALQVEPSNPAVRKLSDRLDAAGSQ
jgi:tetratricopeptide (TPR) repeat protein/Tol biopolymer transport system component